MSSKGNKTKRFFQSRRITDDASLLFSYINLPIHASKFETKTAEDSAPKTRAVDVLFSQHTEGSLQQALDMKGKGPMLRISAELSWRKAKFGWLFAVGHLPTEANLLADALSRLSDPTEPKDFPECLQGVHQAHPTPIHELWALDW